jgi:prepilin peptidase CpaA
MGMFTADHWPLVVISLAMIVAAIFDGVKYKVPNFLTFPTMIAGWFVGLAYDLHWLELPPPSPIYPDSLPPHFSHFAASWVVMMLGFACLYPIRLLNMMGMGDVKMQMGFGSWVGAFYGLYNGCTVFLWAFAVGVIAGGVISLIVMLVDGKLKEHMANAREILTDFITLGPSGIAKKAAERKHRMVLFPYGVGLLVGYIVYLFIANSAGQPAN